MLLRPLLCDQESVWRVLESRDPYQCAGAQWGPRGRGGNQGRQQANQRGCGLLHGSSEGLRGVPAGGAFGRAPVPCCPPQAWPPALGFPVGAAGTGVLRRVRLPACRRGLYLAVPGNRLRSRPGHKSRLRVLIIAINIVTVGKGPFPTFSASR